MRTIAAGSPSPPGEGAVHARRDAPLDAPGLAGTQLLGAAGAGSIFEGVSSLPPGHRMVVDDAGARTECYWDWTFPERPSAALRGRVRRGLRALLIDACGCSAPMCRWAPT